MDASGYETMLTHSPPEVSILAAITACGGQYQRGQSHFSQGYSSRIGLTALTSMLVARLLQGTDGELRSQMVPFSTIRKTVTNLTSQTLGV